MLVKFHVHWSHKVAPCDDPTGMRLDCFCFGCFSIETTELRVGIRKMEHSRDEGVMCRKLKEGTRGRETNRAVCEEDLWW